MRVIGYSRVSTVEQVREGESLEAQESKLRDYAAVMGWELVAIRRDEGVSAKSMDRPGLKAVLELLEAGEADGVLVVKLDRLTRRVADLDRLISRYFGPDARIPRELVAVQERIDTSTATGRMVLGVMAVVSQWERETTAERTSAVLQHKKAQGRVYGQVPYGWRRSSEAKDAKLLPVPAELEAIEKAKGWRGEGLSYRKIARALEAGGYLPRRGNRWAATQVRRLVLQDPPAQAVAG